MSATFYRRVFWWGMVPAVAVVSALTLLTAVLLRPAHLKSVVEKTLSEHLNLTTSVDEISVSFLPRPHIHGDGLKLRLPNRPDLPPFISIATFTMNIGLLSALRKHVDTIEVSGLSISVPPGDARGDLPSMDASAADDGATTSQMTSMRDVIVNRLVSHDAELKFVPREPHKPPLVFAIHELTLEEVGFQRQIPFTVTMTNPVPTGLVKATGMMGPWVKEDGTRTPVSGTYTFTNADLSTINGIGGTLASTGKFAGRLTEIGVTGEARVPDFNLDLGGKPVALTSTFVAVVDATDGSTTLKHVEATMGRTPLVVSGVIANLAGPGNHKVDLDVHIARGRIEDLIALVVTSPRPLLVGNVALNAKFSLPPGKTAVRDRLRLSGTFGLSGNEFKDPRVQNRLQELSRRSQGKDEDDAPERVLMNLQGRFAIANGVLSLPGLTFDVPGADLALGGTYALADGALDFRGTLTMKATVSQAVGGFKSLFLKPFDPLFKKNGAGAVIPIKITGTQESPHFGMEVGKVVHGNDAKTAHPR